MGSFRQGKPGFGGGGDRGSRGGFGGGRSASFSRGGDRGGGRGGFGGGRGGGFGGGDRTPAQMHDATCNKCGKECQVPFRPTGSKPVYCSDCFRQMEGGSSGGNSGGRFGGRDESPRREFAPRTSGPSAPAGMSQEQFKQINAKLDAILLVLKDLEIVADEDEDDEELDETLDATENAENAKEDEVAEDEDSVN